MQVGHPPLYWARGWALLCALSATSLPRRVYNDLSCPDYGFSSQINSGIMSASAFHDTPSDILDDRVDSSHLLLQRLNNWRHAVANVLEYADCKASTQHFVTSSLSKERKTVHNVPNFGGSSVNGGTKSGIEKSAAAIPPSSDNISPSTPSEISNSFTNLAHQIDTLVHESETAIENIKFRVIPPLELLLSDIGKHQKTLKSQGSKHIKDIEKQRESTAKYLESLGKAVSTAGATGTKPDPKTDPYALHRKVLSVAAEQIWLENQFAESNLNVQHNFSSLEQHIIEVLQNAVAQLNEISQRFAKAESVTSASIHQSFNQINPYHEWELFNSSNQQGLVPEVGYQRDPSKVTFSNSSHETTRPLMEGVLNRKGTVLKNNKPGYYVLTQAGFLHEYKSPDYVEDPHAELSLYIPESELGGLPQRGGADFIFEIASKDSGKVLASHHKYSFTANSYKELLAWHRALSRVVGTTSAVPMNDSSSETVSVVYAISEEAASASPQYAPATVNNTLKKSAVATPRTGTYKIFHTAGADNFGSDALGAGGLGAGAGALEGPGVTSYASQNNSGLHSAAAAQGNPGGQYKLGEFSTPAKDFTGVSSPTDLSTESEYGSRGLSSSFAPQQSNYNALGPEDPATSSLGAGTGLEGAGLGAAAMGSQRIGSQRQSHAYSSLADDSRYPDLSKRVGGLVIEDKTINGKTEFNDLISEKTEFDDLTFGKTEFINGLDPKLSGVGSIFSGDKGPTHLGKTEYNNYTSGSGIGTDTISGAGFGFSLGVNSGIGSSTRKVKGNDSSFGHSTGLAGIQSKAAQSLENSGSKVPHYQIYPSKQHNLRSDNNYSSGSGSFGAIAVDSKAESSAYQTHAHGAKIGVLDGKGNHGSSSQYQCAENRQEPSVGLAGSPLQPASSRGSPRGGSQLTGNKIHTQPAASCSRHSEGAF